MSDYIPNTSDLTHREVRLCERIEFLEKLEVQQRHALDAATGERDALKAEAVRAGAIFGRLGILAHRAYSDVSDNAPAEDHMKVLESAFDMWRGSAKGFVRAVADGDKERDTLRADLAAAVALLVECSDRLYGYDENADLLKRLDAFAARRGGTTTSHGADEEGRGS